MTDLYQIFQNVIPTGSEFSQLQRNIKIVIINSNIIPITKE